MDKMEKDLQLWYKLNEEVKDLKVEELALRKKLFGAYFEDPVEGTNTAALENDWVLKGTHKLTRKVIEETLPEFAKRPGMTAVLKNVLNYKPTLVKKEYDKLPKATRKAFDNCLTIKPGTPALSIVLPKKKK